MDLIQKFEKGKTSSTYQRIESAYTVNIFLGYNDDGQMSMVVTEYGKEVPVQSTNVINVQLKKRDDNKLALSFELLNEKFKSIFVIFCNDIINNCEKVGSDMAIAYTLTRWKFWKEMFGQSKRNLLGKAEIKGLIGELVELRDYFFKKWTEEVAVLSWMGPLYGHKDFEIEDTWYEVKSVNENAVQITINSLEQLESKNEGHLVIVRLEETNTVTLNALNLNEIVAELMSLIHDLDILKNFNQKLDNIGYVYDDEYNKYNFLYKGTERYSVNNEFPRIRRSEIKSSIGNVKYTILLEGIVNFKEV